MLEYHWHLDNGKLPPFPPELRISSHISRAEEESMGVGFATSHLHTAHSAEHEQSNREDFSMDGEPEGRKRTFSVLSPSQTSTTASRMLLYSETQCTT